MPPKNKPNGNVIIFDTNSSEDYKSKAIECYKQIAALKSLKLKNAFHKQLNDVKFFITNDTNNPVSEYVQFSLSNVDYLQGNKEKEGDWLHCLHSAVHKLAEDKLIFNSYQVIVFSDFKAKIEKDDTAIKEIISTLNTSEMYIYFLGIDVEIKQLLTSKLDVFNYMSNLNHDKSNEGYEIARIIVEQTNGVMCNFDIGVDLVCSYKCGQKERPFVEPLAFNDLELCTSAFKYTENISLPMIKESGKDKPHYEKKSNREEKVPKKNVISGTAMHGKLIIIPDDVEKGVKNYPKFFKLFGFTDSKNVPNHYMLGDDLTYLVMANTSKDEEEHVNYIIEAAEKYNKYGIALMNSKTKPVLYCLIPKTNPHHFLMIELPDGEDFEMIYRDDEPIQVKEETECDGELKENFYKFLDAIDLDEKIKLHPTLKVDHNLKTKANMLAKKVNGEEITESMANFATPFDLDFNDGKIRELLNKCTVDVQLETAKEEEDPW